MHIASMPAMQMFSKIFLNKILHNQIISDSSSTTLQGLIQQTYSVAGSISVICSGIWI